MKFARFCGMLALPTISSVLIVVPVLTSYRALGFRSLLNFLAPDAMYYAEIANNFQRYGFPTSDGVTTTNGFQPLWGWLLMIWMKLFHVAHDRQLFVIFGLSMVCVIAAYAILSYALYRLLGLLPGLIATLTLFPGWYSLLFEPRTRYGGEGGLLYALNPWSAIDGVESPVVILAWSVLFLSLTHNYTARLLGTSPAALRLTGYFPPAARWCLAAILLGRLEQGLLLIAIAVAACTIPAASRLDRARDAATVLLPACLAGCIYVAFNMITVGTALPVSGLSKIHSGLRGNMHALWFVLRGTIGSTWWLAATRLYPLLFGLSAGVAMLVAAGASRWQWTRAPGQGALPFYLSVFGLFLTMNALFLFGLEPIYSIGYWYFWPIAMVPSVLVSLWLGVWTERHAGLRWPALGFCCALLLFALPNEMYLLDSPDVAQLFAFSSNQHVSDQLWRSRRPIRADLLRRYPDAKLVETFDGVFGFMLDLPARSLTGLISSPQELRRRRAVGFWRSAIEDGYDIVPDFGYLDMRGADRSIEVVDMFRPPSSPVAFFKVKLR